MGLIHWWPLNGDTRDYGLKPKNGKLVGAGNVTTDGIIGKCLSGMTGEKTAAGVSVDNCNLLDEISTEYSASVWIKVHGTHVHYEGAFISSGDWNNKRWTFGIRQENNRIQPLTNASNQNFISLGKTLTIDKWYHVVTVYKDGRAYLYLDGSLVNSVAATAPYQSSATNLCIGRETYASGYFSFNGDICDVRIYDHALSEKEIEEISLGLILHYPFNNPYEIGTKNLCDLPSKYDMNGSISEGSLDAIIYGDIDHSKAGHDMISNSSSIMLPLKTKTYDGVKKLRLKIFDSLNDGILEELLSNKGRISVSFKKRVRQYYAGSELSLLAEYVINGETIIENLGVFDGHKPNYYDLGKWYYMTKSIVLPNYSNITDVKLYIDLDNVSVPDIYYSGDLGDTEARMIFKDIQVEAKSRPTPFLEREFQNFRTLNISDASGYNNNSLGYSNIEMTYISPIGNYSVHFNGNDPNSYITVKQPKINLLLEPFTINIWCFFDNDNKRDVLFGVYSGGKNSFKLERTDEEKLRFVEIINGVITLDTTANCKLHSLKYEYPDWYQLNYNNTYMITMTYDGSSIRIYNNGEKIATISHTLQYIFDYDSSEAPYFLLGTDNIGSQYSLIGGISDFKIYSTVLDDKKISELFNVKAEVSHDGSLYCGEIYSDSANITNVKNIISKEDIYYDGFGYLRIPVKIVPHQKYTISVEKEYKIKKIDFYLEDPILSVEYFEDKDYYRINRNRTKLVKGFYVEKSYWTFSTDFIEDNLLYADLEPGEYGRMFKAASAYYSSEYFSSDASPDELKAYNGDLCYAIISVCTLYSNDEKGILDKGLRFDKDTYLNPKPTLLIGKEDYTIIRPIDKKTNSQSKAPKINKNYQVTSRDIEEHDDVFEIYKDGFIKSSSFNEN